MRKLFFGHWPMMLSQTILLLVLKNKSDWFLGGASIIQQSYFIFFWISLIIFLVSFSMLFICNILLFFDFFSWVASVFLVELRFPRYCIKKIQDCKNFFLLRKVEKESLRGSPPTHSISTIPNYQDKDF